MLERRRCATDRVEGRWNARCRTSGGGGGGIGDRDGKDVAGTGEGGAGRRGDGLAINFGARSVAHMCTGYAFGKSEEHIESWIGREKLFLSSALRVKICQKRKYIYVYV